MCRENFNFSCGIQEIKNLQNLISPLHCSLALSTFLSRLSLRSRETTFIATRLIIPVNDQKSGNVPLREIHRFKICTAKITKTKIFYKILTFNCIAREHLNVHSLEIVALLTRPVTRAECSRLVVAHMSRFELNYSRDLESSNSCSSHWEEVR